MSELTRIATTDAAALMKRCQRGVGGRHAMDDAHSIMADCYGTIGALVQERDALAAAIAQARRDAMEEAAALCDQMGGRLHVDAKNCAAAIRELAKE